MRFAWLMVGLAGCPWVVESKYETDIRDVDGDGGIDERFGGPDCRPEDPTIADCDADGDGFLATRAGGDDCDDDQPLVHPGADERCDGIDNDCDGRIDTEAIDRAPLYRDADGDGFGEGEPVLACGTQAGFVDNDEDCNDDNELIRPGAQEFCDGIDRDCDGDAYDPDSNDASQRFVDNDGDGQGAASASVGCALPGFSFTGGDCDDSDPDIYIGAYEVPYDGIDQACDGADGEFDADGDGYESRAPDNDCDDTNPGIHPGAVEACDGVDTDCDGLPDTLDPDVLALGPLPQWFQDADGDGSGDPAVTFTACPGEEPAGSVRNDDDCNDLSSAVNPTADERCDGSDNDCDGQIDEGAIDATVRFTDADGDGHGTPNIPVLSCASAPNTSGLNDDCNDADPEAYPGAPEVCGDGELQDCSNPSLRTDCDQDGEDDVALGGTDCDDTRATVSTQGIELCDGIDNDCDTLLDGDDPDTFGLTATVYEDLDGDGFGTGVSIASSSCDLAPGEAGVGGDCDDDDRLIFPSAPERCNGEDDDCDGSIDENAGSAADWYPDTDGDGLGDAAQPPVAACNAPIGHVANALDCDDSNPLVGVHYLDEDGDGAGDPTMPQATCDVGVPNRDDCNDQAVQLNPDTIWYVASTLQDNDEDGWFRSDAVAFRGCQAPGPSGWIVSDLVGDCDDDQPQINPGAPSDLCDGLDNDCDGTRDEDEPLLREQGYLDLDGDGFGAGVEVEACGTVANADDCDDDNPEVNPDEDERCDNIDNDCDGEVDHNVPLYVDGDGDGFGGTLVFDGLCGDSRWTEASGDCDDNDPQRSPGTEESCFDGIDNDCNQTIDDADPHKFEVRYPDLDGDGFTGAPEAVCTLQAGWTESPTCLDGDDADPEVGWVQSVDGSTSLDMVWGEVEEACRANTTFLLDDVVNLENNLHIDPGQTLRLSGNGSSVLFMEQAGSIDNQGGTLDLRELSVIDGFLIQSQGLTRLQGVSWTTMFSNEFPLLQIDGGDLEIGASSLTADNLLETAQDTTTQLGGTVDFDGQVFANGVSLAPDTLVTTSGPVSLEHVHFGTDAILSNTGLGDLFVTDLSRDPSGLASLLNDGGNVTVMDTVLEGPGDMAFSSLPGPGQGTFEFRNVLLEQPILDGQLSFFESTIGRYGGDGILTVEDSIVAGPIPAGFMINNVAGSSEVFTDPQADPSILRSSLVRWFTTYQGPVDLRRRDLSPFAAPFGAGYRTNDGYHDDVDDDGLPDGWERRWLGSTDEDDASNNDGDLLSNLEEYLAGTLPGSNDTDGDTRLDSAEIPGCELNPSC